MARAGLQRTCPQQPHGGYETLSLRSELKAGSCQRLQGRKGLPGPTSPPQHTPLGRVMPGTVRARREGPLVFLYLPSTTALTRAWPGAEASAQLRTEPPMWGPWAEQKKEGC